MIDAAALTATRYQVVERVATIWLHRPHRHNAWTGRMHAEYRALLAAAHADPDVRAVVITGTPPAFCVGGDRQALQGHAERGTYDAGVELSNTGVTGLPAHLDADFVMQLGLRVPVIAAVNGACAGVGLAAAMFCDLRFVAADAKITTAAPKLGLPAEYGLSWILPRLCGVGRAADLLYSGRVVTGAETAEWGLWNGVAADGDGALAMAQEYARRLAHEVGPTALATTKAQLMRDMLEPDGAAAVHRANELLARAVGTDEYREGIAAFAERRPPSFT